jgi:hypothetical protein
MLLAGGVNFGGIEREVVGGGLALARNSRESAQKLIDFV